VGEGRLEIDRVSKRYGDVVALREMTFDVRAGELFGFVGSNGAGKTTTMRIALGVLSADAGEVRFDGTPLTLSARRRIGYMPEERGLYPKMKVGEQLAYLAELHGLTPVAARRAARAWAERLGVAHRFGDEVQTLSLGNQQRVQLAAALVHDPRVLVLDEPFSGLDPVAVDVMSDVLRERRAHGVPVVFSSHQLELVERLCDRVGIVRDGAMVANGTVDELRDGGESVLVVDAPAAADGWADGLPGVTVTGRDATRTLLSLAPGADDQLVLRAALATGPVREFAHRRPSLAALFRSVVVQDNGLSGGSAAGAGAAPGGDRGDGSGPGRGSSRRFGVRRARPRGDRNWAWGPSGRKGGRSS
jgi:ABC-2 type transport system ATP-binding protein